MDNRLANDIETLLQRFRTEIQERIDDSLRDALSSVLDGRPSLAASLVQRKPAPVKVAPRKVGRPARKQTAAALPFARPSGAYVAPKKPFVVRVTPKQANKPAASGPLAQSVDNAVILEVLLANPLGLGLKALAGKLGADKEVTFKALKGLRAERRVVLEGEKRGAVYKSA